MANAQDLAPAEIRPDVIMYRRSVLEYLDALRQEPRPTSFDAAQQAQEHAADVVNGFVDEKCF
jgi:hypothetical protein